MTPKRILQIIPADGWYARFENLDMRHEWYEMLACWALVQSEEETHPYVDGIIGATADHFAQDMDYFDCFVHRSDAEEWEGKKKPWGEDT